jgi:hypothetical protein
VFFGPFPLLARRRVSRPHLRGSLDLFFPECKMTQGLSVSRKVQLRVKPSFGVRASDTGGLSHLAPHPGEGLTTALGRLAKSLPDHHARATGMTPNGLRGLC